MTRAEAAELVHRRRLYVSGGPAPIPAGSKEPPSSFGSWAVAPRPTGSPRGCGPSLELAVADLLAQEAGVTLDSDDDLL